MPQKREETSPMLRPVPQRTWQITPTPTEPTTPDSPAMDANSDEARAIPPSRTRSILNLTSSTLFGIYEAPSGDSFSDFSQSTTPWGTGTMTPSSPTDKKQPSLGAWERPALRRAPHSHQNKATVTGTLLRSALLLVLGAAYGSVTTHLHEETGLVPVKIDGLSYRYSWPYRLFWGVTGVVLGNLLPWIDEIWRDSRIDREARKAPVGPYGGQSTNMNDANSLSTSGEEDSVVNWNTVVRGLGAFVGIAFAIKKTPWESTLQASLTLALANPVLWYLVDRSVPGFALSTVIGIGGTAAILGVNPNWVPTPAVVGNSTITALGAAELGNLISYEGVAVFTWIASVLFCSSVCFGNIGRLLARK